MRDLLFKQLLLVLVFLITACTTSKELRNQPQTTIVDDPTTEDEDIIVQVTPDEYSLLFGIEDSDPPLEYRATAKRVNDLLHTKLDVRFDWKKRQVIGQATLDLKPYFYPTATLVLDAKGFDIHEVALVTTEGKEALHYIYDQKHLEIDLDKLYTKDETYTIFIDYTAKPDELVENSNEVTYDNKGLFFINPDGKDPYKPTQIWTQGETESSSCWFPTIDHPNERTTQETSITVASKYITLANGVLKTSTENGDSTRTDYWTMEDEHPPYLFALVVGEYAVVKETWRGKEISYYVEPAYEAYAKEIFTNTLEMLDFYSDLLDYDYPWQKYAQIVVRDFVAGAMENTTAVIFYEGMHATSRELEDDNNEDIVAHELFHHWFGDLITCESWANLPLNEAFATYGEYLWFEHKYGRDAADYHIQRDLNAYLAEADNKQVPIFRFRYKHADDLFDRHSYQKGGRVLHTLRKYIGDDAFFESLKFYVSKYANQTVEIHNLRQAFETITGEDLNWFFNQWFLTPGHPEIDIQYSYDEAAQLVRVTVQQTQTSTKPFRLPIAVDIYHANGKVERKNVVIEEQTQALFFEAAALPKLVNVDAEKALLGIKNDEKTIDNWIYQYQHAPLYLDRHEAIAVLDEHQGTNVAARNTLIEALKDEFWSIRKAVINRIELDSKETIELVTPILKKLAENDKKAAVRAAAIGKLSELKDKAMLPMLERMLQDPSFTVIAAALSTMYELEPEGTLELAKTIEHEENNLIINVIAKIYSEQAAADKQSFFADKLSNPSMFDRYSLIDYYRDFLNRNGEPIVEEGLPILKKIAIDDTEWWVRLNATQAITGIRTIYFERKKMLEETAKNNEASIMLEVHKIENRIEMIDEILTTIKTSETNERLLDYYRNM